MNAQHRINKRNARMRRINRQIEWWTAKTVQKSDEKQTDIASKILAALKGLKAKYEQVTET